MTNPAIETRGLCKFYGKTRGVQHLSLRVEAGDFYGFLGPNGAGKSTTLRLLTGLISPTGGSASVLGLDCRTRSTDILARVGYLPSETAFYHGMRVSEALRFSAGLRRKDCRARARELCDRLALDMNRRAEDLSMGNRKKLGIVCAMQHDPELYILDEPTSGLDPLIQRAFFELLEEHNRAGATVFLSSHVLSEVQRHCRNAAVIRDGAVVAEGAVEELMRSSARSVHVSGVERPPELPGVKNITPMPGGVSFLYAGDMRALVTALANMPVTDLSIAEPDIEDTFLHFYQKEDERA